MFSSHCSFSFLLIFLYEFLSWIFNRRFESTNLHASLLFGSLKMWMFQPSVSSGILSEKWTTVFFSMWRSVSHHLMWQDGTQDNPLAVCFIKTKRGRLEDMTPNNFYCILLCPKVHNRLNWRIQTGIYPSSGYVLRASGQYLEPEIYVYLVSLGVKCSLLFFR